jgi:hypothetical protein
MNTFPVLLAALCIYALAYRYYSAFIAAKVLALDITMLRRRAGFSSDITSRPSREQARWSVQRWRLSSDLLRDFSGS